MSGHARRRRRVSTGTLNLWRCDGTAQRELREVLEELWIALYKKTKLRSEEDSLARPILYTQEGAVVGGAALVLIRWLPGVASR